MSCHEFSDDRVLAAYGEPTSDAWRDHAAACGECREEVEALRQVRAAYDRTEAMPAPLRKRISRPPRMRWAMAVAAALMAVMVGWVLRPAPPPAAEVSWERIDRGISDEIGTIDQELQWHELVLKD